LTEEELREFRDRLAQGRALSTVNRTITPLKAALELVGSKFSNRAAWRDGLRKFEGADNPRNVVIIDDTPRLVALAYEDSVEFGRFVETGAACGARPSQLSRLLIEDLQADWSQGPRLMMPTSAKGKKTKKISRRPVPISTTLAAKLRAAAVNRP